MCLFGAHIIHRIQLHTLTPSHQLSAYFICMFLDRLTGQGVVGMDNVGALGLPAELKLGTAVAKLLDQKANILLL